MPTTLILDKEVVSGGNLKPAPITMQFDPALVAPHILLAEHNYIVKALGREMYEDMVSVRNPLPCNYNAALGAIVLKFPSNPNYETLWTEYLFQLCGYVVILEALPMIALSIGTNGVFAINTDYADNMGVKGATFLEDRLKQKIQTLQVIMRDWLCRNAADYEKFDYDCNCVKACGCEIACDCGELEPKSKGYGGADGGLIFDPNRKEQPYTKRTDFFF